MRSSAVCMPPGVLDASELVDDLRFTLHKLVVADRRDREKAEKDRAQAVMVLQAVKDAGNAKQIAEIHASLPAKWQRVIEGSLGKCAEPEAIQLLNSA